MIFNMITILLSYFYTKTSSKNEIVTIKPEYWKDNDMEHIWTHIKKGYEPEEWVHQDYKFIPRRRIQKIIPIL